MTTPLPLPASLRYGRVTGRVIRGVGDSIADTDLLPEGALIQGLQVVFTPAVPRIVATAEQTVVLPAPVTCAFDDQGFLVHNGQRGVYLLATDVGNPVGWTWRAAFSGSSVANWSFDFELPTDAVIDISTVAPIPTSSGQAIVRGASAYDIAVASGYVGTQAQWLASLKGDPGAASMARGIASDLNALHGAANAGSWSYESAAVGAPSAANGIVTVSTSTAIGNRSNQIAADTNGSVWARFQIAVSGTVNWTAWKRLDTQDTGWRVLSSWGADGVVTGDALPANVTPSIPGAVKVRRIGDLVRWQITGLAFSGQAIWQAPVGFRATTSNNYCVTPVVVGVTPTIAFAQSAKIAIGATGLSATAGSTYAVVFEHFASEAFPTTLPGTPA